MEDKIKRWENIGMLEGIDDNDKELLANYFEQTYLESIYFELTVPEPLNKTDKEISIWIYPLIYRVYKHIKNINISDLKSKFEDYVKNGEMESHANQFPDIQGIDIESECLGHFSEKYVQEILGNMKPLS